MASTPRNASRRVLVLGYDVVRTPLDIGLTANIEQCRRHWPTNGPEPPSQGC